MTYSLPGKKWRHEFLRGLPAEPGQLQQAAGHLPGGGRDIWQQPGAEILLPAVILHAVVKTILLLPILQQPDVLQSACLQHVHVILQDDVIRDLIPECVIIFPIRTLSGMHFYPKHHSSTMPCLACDTFNFNIVQITSKDPSSSGSSCFQNKKFKRTTEKNIFQNYLNHIMYVIIVNVIYSASVNC